MKYSSIPSQSKEGVVSVPSTPGQLLLAQMLKRELEEMEMEDISLSENGVLIAHLEGTTPPLP